MKRSRKTRRARALAAAVAALQFIHVTAQAGISFTSGSVQYTHFKNNGSSIDVDGPFSFTSTGHHTYSHSFSQSHDGVTAKTNARGGVGIVSNATTATFTLDSGTGVTESDPAPNPVWGAGSRLRMNLTNLQWNATSPSFGPTATAYFSVTVAGVIGSGGAGTFSPNITFSRLGNPGFASVTSGLTFPAGSFSKTLTKSFSIPGGSIPTAGTFTVDGHLDFHVNNEDTPSLIEPTVVDTGGAPPTARFDSENEITPFGGASWNDPLVWSAEQEFVPGGVPNHVGDRAFFAPPTNAPRARAVSIDSATVTLGTLDIDDVFGGSMTVAANSGTLQFQVPNGGTFGTDVQNAVIQQRNTRGNAIAEISAPVQLMNPLDVHVNSSAGLTISGAINTAPGLISPTPINKFGPGVLTLSGTNSFVGGIVVNDGGLVLSGAAVSNIPITAAAGTTVTFNTTAPGVIYDTNFNAGTANGGRTINVTGFGISAPGLSGAAPLTLNAPSTLSITSNSNNTGTVAIASGTLSLTSGGNMTGVPEFVNNGVLRLDNSAVATSNRIGNTATVRLRGGQMRVDAHPTTAVNETYGATILDGGQSTYTLANSGAAALTVTSSALQRQNNGAVFFRGDNLGSALGSRLIFATPPTLIGGGGTAGNTNISIIPFAYTGANSGTTLGTSLVTHTPTGGVRPLVDATEYATNLTTSTINDNVRVNAAVALAAPANANALVLGNGVGVSGATTLGIQSGLIIFPPASNAAVTTSTINFGAAEGILITQSNLNNNINGAMYGSGGLTKAGPGVLVIQSSNNGYTGTTSVVAGTLLFSANVGSGTLSPLGNSTSAVVLAPGAGAEANLQASPAGTATLGRAVISRGSPTALRTLGTPISAPNQTLVMSGTIGLEQTLRLVGGADDTMFLNNQISGAGGLIVGSSGAVQIGTVNTFAGGITLSSGTTRVGHNLGLGTGPITFAGGAMQATNGAKFPANNVFLVAAPTICGTAELTLSGPMDLGGTRTHTITNTADTIYAGQLMNGGLTKAGAGRLVISNYNNYNGLTTVAAGELLVYGAKPLGDPVSGTIVNAGATLRLGENLVDSDVQVGSVIVTQQAPNPARMVEPVIINGTGVGGSGALRGSAPATAVGTLTLASASTVHVEPTNTLAVLTLSDFTSTLTLNGGGTLAVDRVRGGNVIINGSTLTVRPCNLTANPRPNAASSITTLNVGGGGALNLNNNAMVINYAGASSLAATSALLASGYNSGAWNGPGIRSQSAADTPNTAIGVAEAFETNYVGSFFGEPIDTTSLLLVYTRAGDANLDRIVNIADFSKLAANFNLSSTWARGDFNYDGMTNISDFAILAANFNQSAPPDLPRSSVPEPVSSLLLLSAAALRRRRY